tara:strand:+ start:5185 stop:5697 length:513 start_codon:yes stop_codon:yes gene_type:complete
MGFDPVTAAVMGGAKTGLNFLGGMHAAKAAEYQAEYESELLQRQADNERETMQTNRRRKGEDRDRYLARVRMEQANSGAGMQGTNEMVFDTITSRVDERINDMTEQHYAHIGRLEDGKRMTLWKGKQSAAAHRMNAYAGAIGDTFETIGNVEYAKKNTTPGQAKGVWNMF